MRVHTRAALLQHNFGTRLGLLDVRLFFRPPPSRFLILPLVGTRMAPGVLDPTVLLRHSALANNGKQNRVVGDAVSQRRAVAALQTVGRPVRLFTFGLG